MDLEKVVKHTELIHIQAGKYIKLGSIKLSVLVFTVHCSFIKCYPVENRQSLYNTLNKRDYYMIKLRV
jgi:hypothetical protein